MNMKFKGTVVHGQKRGGTLPTLNLDVKPKIVQGVYAVWVHWEDRAYPGAMNWGPQPTFGSDEPVVEIHLLEGEGDWYGREVLVEFVQQIREVKQFDSSEELLEQIKQDLVEVSQVLELN